MNKDFIFAGEQVLSKSTQIIQSFGLNALKQKFYKFDAAPTEAGPDKFSNLGTPMFDTVTIYGNGTNGDISYYDLQQEKTVTVPKLVIDIALITVHKVVNVSKTNVVGANGSVKQYINLGDYSIEIKGVFTSEIPNTRPDELIRQLHKITSSTCEVNIACDFLNLFGINCIVFDGEQTFDMNESNRDVQKFVLNCTSETPISIKVIQQGQTSSNTQNTSFLG